MTAARTSSDWTHAPRTPAVAVAVWYRDGRYVAVEAVSRNGLAGRPGRRGDRPEAVQDARNLADRLGVPFLGVLAV